MESIPEDVLLMIFSYLDMDDLCLGVRSVCHRWHDLSYHSELWKSLNFYDKRSYITDEKFINALRPICKKIERLSLTECVNISDHALKHHLIFCPKLKHLRLGSTNITLSGLLYLVRKYPNLHSLDILFCEDLSDSDFSEIYQVYSHLKGLRKFCFDADEYPPICDREFDKAEEATDVKNFSRIITNNPLMLSANITWDAFNNELFSVLCNTCVNLTKLTLVTCYELTGPGVINNVCKLRHLKSFTIQDLYSMRDSDLGCLASEQLRRIDISVCQNVTNAGIAMMMKNCPNVTSLTINTIRLCEGVFEKEECPHINHAFDDVYYAKLVHLNIKHCQGLLSLVLRCPNLENLEMTFIEPLTDSIVIRIAEACRKLKDVGFYRCEEFGSDGIASLFRNCPLKRLVVCKGDNNNTTIDFTLPDQPSPINFFRFHGCAGLTPSSLHSIANCCHNLRELWLYGCHSINDAAIIAISQQCKLLEILELSLGSAGKLGTAKKSLLTDECLVAIGEHCTNLCRIVFDSDFSFSFMAFSHLLKCPNLKYIEFEGILSPTRTHEIEAIIVNGRGSCRNVYIPYYGKQFHRDRTILRFPKIRF